MEITAFKFARNKLAKKIEVATGAASIVIVIKR